jgi:Zinc carboxypeptidase
MSRSFFFLMILTAAISFAARSRAQDTLPKTHAEVTDYIETSRYEDVLHFIGDLQARSPLLRVETFGRSKSGRNLPLMILADPPVSTPRQALGSGRPIVFVMANIHAGEVEGKESAQALARRLLLGDGKALLQKMTVLIAPIYNADGNERIDPRNRSEQNGPLGGVGVRENADGLDLNRDFMKLESPEARGLVSLFNRWDPHLTVDLHTTNGSYHGYHLTYSIPLNPSTPSAISDYQRDVMMPAIARKMLDRHKFRTYYYGNFSRNAAPGKPGRSPSWLAFTHEPRIGQNYTGLRNRLNILSEAYSYLDFRRRVEATTAFVDEILDFVVAHGPEVVNLTRAADEQTVRDGLQGELAPLGVAHEMRPLPESVEILVGEVTRRKHPKTGLEMTVMIEDKITPTMMQDFGKFAATRTVRRPRAYLIPPEKGHVKVLDTLLAHGVSVEVVSRPFKAEVESFVVDEIKRAGRSFQGHQTVKLTGKTRTETMDFPPGTLLVRTAQPLGTLASYLLEPESDDGLVTWNFLDDSLAPGKPVPIFKFFRDEMPVSQLFESKP